MLRDDLQVCILTIQEKFSRNINYHTSLDVQRIVNMLAELGIKAYSRDIETCVNFGLETGTTHVLFGGHLNPTINSYFFDYALYLNGTIKSLPSLDLIFCYENKGLQGLIAKKKGLSFTGQKYYFSTVQPSPSQTQVYKSLDGAGSSGVKLIANAKEISKINRREAIRSLNFSGWKSFLKYKIGSLIRTDQSAKLRYLYLKPYSRFVLQDFLSGLTHDYKVLVFGDLVYVLKRFTRKKDFRASGSGNFVFIEPPHKLLDFSWKFYKDLEVPYISLDVVESADGYEVIEFQAIHFGSYTQTNAPFHYHRTSNSWEKSDRVISLEECYALGVSDFLQSERI